MNNEEKKVEQIPTKNDEKSYVADPSDEEKLGKPDSITKKIQIKNLDKTSLNRCITIFNIDYATTEDELMSHFKKVNGFKKMVLLKDPQHPELKNRGIAYITYKTAEDSDNAIKQLNRSLIGNRRIRIEKSYDQETKIKQKQIKKSISSSKPPSHPVPDLDEHPPLEPELYTHSKTHSEHQRRSHHSLREKSLEPYDDDDDNFHHHSYRHHRSSSHYSEIIDPSNFEYNDQHASVLHPHIAAQIDALASFPQDYQALAPPAPIQSSSLYSDPSYFANDAEVSNDFEDKVNELSILAELYRDALLTKNMRDGTK